MNENDFEGTLVLEKIAEIGRLDEFYEAIDSDDFNKVRKLMKRAGIDKVIKIIFQCHTDHSVNAYCFDRITL